MSEDKDTKTSASQDAKADPDAYIGEEGWDNLASDLDLSFLDEDQE